MRKKNKFFWGGVIFFALLGIVQTAWAASPEVPAISAGDTSWVLISAALVFLMTPGLAFFYGGLVRKKNMLSILMQCFILICMVTLQWILFGYSLAFGPDVKGQIGPSVLGGLVSPKVSAAPQGARAGGVRSQRVT